MFINSFNYNRIPTYSMSLPAPQSYGMPQAQPLIQTSGYTPVSQSAYGNSGNQFGFSGFQGQSFFRPITQTFAGFGNNLINGFNSGLQGLRQMSPTMPTWPTQQTAPVQPQIPPQQINAPAASRPTVRQMFNNIGQGAQQGFQDFTNMARQHGPMMLSVGAGVAGACAVCPFMGSTMAATGGIMLAQQNNAANN